MVLLYNRDMFDEAGVDYPLDWDQDQYLSEGLKFLQQDDSGKLVRWGGHSIVKANVWLENILRRYGGSVADTGDWTRCALGDDEAQAGLEWIYKCIWEDNMWPQTAQIENYWYAPFDSGSIATQESGSWIIGIWYEAIQDRFGWDFAPCPSGPAGRASNASSDCYTGWSKTPHPDETWEVLKWMVSDDMEICMMEAQGSEPGRRSLYSEWYRIVKEQFPLMAEDTNWNAFEQAVRQGYDYVASTFIDPGISSEILTPALELFVDVGEVKPDYFKGIADEITEAIRAEYA
jgi:ABC-type glycerol-3-phosphate transport system substrate-binding protein